MRLPLSILPARAFEAISEGAAARCSNERRQTVLVVDDNRDTAEMVSALLTAAGHAVQIACDASQALSMAATFHAQVAVLDIGLPVMDGYALGRELRVRAGSSAPILIALTGYGQEQDLRRSAEAGFAAHLVKPVDAQRLIRLVDSLNGTGATEPASGDAHGARRGDEA